MRYSRLSALLPCLDWTDAAFEFSFMCNSEMVSKLGVLTIRASIINGTTSIILSIEEGMMGMVCSDQ